MPISSLGGRSLLAVVLLVAAYMILYATTWTANAVLLVVMLPLGLACLAASVLIWLLAVLREAKEKDLL